MAKRKKGIACITVNKIIIIFSNNSEAIETTGIPKNIAKILIIAASFAAW